jgi:hypothetical protein
MLSFLKQVGDMIQGMAMEERAMVAVAVAVDEVVDGGAEEMVILGVMEVGIMSLALQDGDLVQGTTMKVAGEAMEVGMDGAVVEMIMVGAVVAVHGVAVAVVAGAHGEMLEMAVGTHGEKGEVVVVVGAGRSSLRNWFPLSLMLVTGVEEVGDGNKHDIFLSLLSPLIPFFQ